MLLYTPEQGGRFRLLLVGAVSTWEQNSGCKYPGREHFLPSQLPHLAPQEAFAILLSLTWERLC